MRKDFRTGELIYRETPPNPRRRPREEQMRGREDQNHECWRTEFGNGGEGTFGVQREGCSPVGVDHCQVVGDNEVPTGQPPSDEAELVPEVYGKEVTGWSARAWPSISFEKWEFACDRPHILTKHPN